MGKIAFVFAGQGAQYPGMGKGLYASSPAAKEVFDACEKIRPGTLRQCFEGAKEELAQTVNTQPCLFAMDLACAMALQEAGVQADCAAGFSLGEVAAVAFTGMLSLEKAFELVCARAKLMQACGEKAQTAMAAILKLKPDQVEALCAEFQEVYPVNYNCPGQIVAAGIADQIDALMARAGEMGGRAMKLNVSGGFHSPFMDEAAKGMAELTSAMDFSAPRIPLYANLTAQPYGSDAASTLSRQVNHPVRWQTAVENMMADGVDTFIEVGAGKTLCGLIKKIGGAKLIRNVEDPETLDACVQALKEA